MLGEQIMRGMAVTAKNFFGSYVSKNRLTTVQYPEERLSQKANTRQFPMLVFDGDPDKGLRCVACTICEKECPPQCIYIVKSKDKKPDYKGQPQLYPAVFDIDVSVCMSCSICVEVCPFESIKMNTEFELSTDDRFEGLLFHKDKLSKSNEYYHQLHPADARDSDAVLAAENAKAEAKAKAAAEARAKAAATAATAATAVLPTTAPATATPPPPAPTPAAAAPPPPTPATPPPPAAK
jgi:NADH-quinone oxidoreductase subunit I